MSVIVTLEDLAAYLKRDFDAYDAYTAQQLLDGAEALITEYCGWHITPKLSESVTVDGTGTALLPLPTLNLVSLDSVSENGLLLDLRYLDWSANGLVEKRRGNNWTNRRRGIITYITHGYATTPGWLLTMICAIAGRAFLSPVGGIVQETAGGESVTYARPTSGTPQPGAVGLAALEMRMLDRIRIPASA